MVEKTLLVGCLAVALLGSVPPIARFIAGQFARLACSIATGGSCS
jgi:Flp pilus assembly pilin Flp